MKRESQDGSPDSKRQKVESERTYHTYDSTVARGRDSKIQSIHTKSTTQDPSFEKALAVLQSSLTELATKPDLVSAVLGPTAAEPMQALLARLKVLKRKAPLDTFFPSTFNRPAPTPSGVEPIRSFEPNPVPSAPFALPPLPPILPGPYVDVPFIHRSVAPTDRVIGASLAQFQDQLSTSSPNGKQHQNGQEPTTPTSLPRELNYERLEFLGDSYLSVIASNLIFSRFPHLRPGQQSILRSALVSNDTLMRFSRAYGFDTRVQAQGFSLSGAGLKAAVRQGVVLAGNKGINKILADVFEAYVAAAILSDPKGGFGKVERWLRDLWTPILLESQGRNFQNLAQVIQEDTFLPNAEEESDQAAADPQGQLGAEQEVEAPLVQSLPLSSLARPDEEYNHLAKAQLQKLIAPNHVRLVYKDVKPSSSSSSAWAQAVHLTGWGYKDLLLGTGEGSSKVEAGNRAAMAAFEGSKGVVEECAGKFEAEKQAREREKEEKFKRKMEAKHNNGEK